MKRLLALITACMTCTYISAGQQEWLQEHLESANNPESYVQEAVKTQSATSNVAGFSSKKAPALPRRDIKVWTQNANVANTLTTKKDKQKFEALLASAEAILDNQQVTQQKQRFASNWKALNDQLGRAHYGLSPSAWLEGISWRDRLIGIHAALEYILGQINAKPAYAENEKIQLVSDISELISKTSNELNK